MRGVDTGDSCESRQRCEWCVEPLDPATSDELRPWASYGCCRFCKEIE